MGSADLRSSGSSIPRLLRLNLGAVEAPPRRTLSRGESEDWNDPFAGLYANLSKEERNSAIAEEYFREGV
eukprot:CAMPEP_0114487952 /NCGR_PEP_ID=MMETSP0109-20121206/1054_1 /TAXON_ID=29199 /ORGANISM="Chlorarachnion reptans, Strain CCCM449" /LENGTH=69 /DNA_ID=CAMNT_0001664279 /DNA_START=273 /DNA_END=482 /DNA_ORIENTATION=-